jgi:hypothetical protein
MIDPRSPFSRYFSAALVALPVVTGLLGAASTARADGPLALVSYFDAGQPHMRAYGSKNGMISESVYDNAGPWHPGAFPTVAGTAVAATSWTDGTSRHLRVYVANGGTIMEYSYDGAGWTAGQPVSVGTAPSITSWVDAQNVVHLHLNFLKNGSLAGLGWTGHVWESTTVPTNL